MVSQAREGLAEAKWGRLGLALLLLFFLSWDLRAVLLDNRPGAIVSDSTLSDVMSMQGVVADQGFGEWVRQGSVKGPLAALLVQALGALVGDPLLAARLLSVLLHLITLWLLYWVTHRLTSRPYPSLLAVVLCGTLPLQYGWFRMDFHEPLVALAVLATLVLMLPVLDPGRQREPRLITLRRGLLLGLVVGLGLLTKPSYLIFVLLPGLWFIARAARDRRGVLNLLLGAGVAGIIAGWWFYFSLGELIKNLGDSTHAGVPWLTRLANYTVDLPGMVPFLLAACAGAGLCAWRRTMPKDALVLILLGLASSLVVFLFIFDPWTRYLVPALPLAGVLVAAGVCALGQRMGRGHLQAYLFLGLAPLLLLQYVFFNLRGLESALEEREFFLGMVAPDTRTYDAFPQAAALVRARGWPVVELPSGPNPQAFPALWFLRGHTVTYTPLDDARALVAAGREVYLIFSFRGEARPDGPLERLARRIASTPAGHDDKGADPEAVIDPSSRFSQQDDPAHDEERLLLSWLAPLNKQVVRTFEDPDAVSYSIIRLTRSR